MKSIAFFDFDGTITTKDTLLEIIKFQKGNARFYIGFLLHAPWLLAYKTGLLSNQLAKEKILRFFFKKMPLATFQQQCDAFAEDELPHLLRPKALKEIALLQSKGTEVVIVSASAENWIQKWCSQNKLELIGTKLEIKENTITGRIDGNNCYGNEKVRRIKERFQLENFSHIFCYGDTKGDKPMLQLATFSFYKPFR